MKMGNYDVSNFNGTRINGNDTFIERLVDNDSYIYNNMNIGQPPVRNHAFLNIFMEFTKWAILVIVAFGVIGNIICFYIFTKTKLKRISSSRYFCAIAFVDTGYLLSKLCTHLIYLEVNVLYVPGLCPLVMYINHICTFLSIWYVTALVTEKFIGLYWPSKKAHYCTVFRAKCVIITFAVLAVVCYHYITWTVGYSSFVRQCTPWPEDELAETWLKLNKVDEAVVSIIPYLVIFVLSCLIAARTWRFYKRNRSTGFRLHRRQTAFIPQDKEYKTSGLLLLVSFVTFFLGITHSVARVFLIIDPPELYFIALFLQTNSYSIKPYLYTLGSRPYRKEIWKLLRPFFICKQWFRNSSLSELHTVNHRSSDSITAIEVVVEKTM